METSLANVMATLCLFAALVHSLSVRMIERLARRFQHRAAFSAFLHFAAEIEVVFGLWAAIYVAFLMVHEGFHPAVDWLDQRNFSEAIFIFVIMAMAATRPILELAERCIDRLARLLPLPKTFARYLMILIVGPLLGSLITEPAAMTLSALLLKREIFDRSKDSRLLYSTVAVLFVNVSIGGVLTPFAAPPVLMVARTWNWDLAHMFTHFGWKAVVAVVINSILALLFNRSALSLQERTSLDDNSSVQESRASSAIWIKGVHLAFLTLAILTAHHPAFLVGAFLFFIGFTHVTRFAQSELKIQESLLVAFFLGGLIVLTAQQGWWLQPLLTSAKDFVLFAGATLLTAITDNAALTSLAARVHDLSEASKYAVVAGAVSGGGLTLIANAPNPAGYAILRENFEDGLQPLRFLGYAIIPTLIAGGMLWIR